MLPVRFVFTRCSLSFVDHVCRHVTTTSAATSAATAATTAATTAGADDQIDFVSKLTKELFQNTFVSLNQIDVLLHKNSNKMTFHDFALLMRNSSRQKIKLRKSQLLLISKSLSTITADPKVEDIGQLMYSLHIYDDSQPHIISIMEVMSMKLKLAGTVNPRVTENVLFGMRNMSCDSTPVREMLNTLSCNMQSCNEDYTSVQISNSLNGLRCMKNSTCAVEVNAILYELCQKMKNIKMLLNSREVSNSLLGFRGIDSSNASAREVLLHLADHLRQSRQIMHCVDISSSLFSLQKMSSEYVEVRSIFEVLAYKIEEAANFGVSLDNIGQSNVLYAMQNLTCGHAEVKKLMCALSRIIHKSKGSPMTSNQLSNAVFGFQNMWPSCNEVLDLITLLDAKVEEFDGKLNAEQVGKCLLGVRNMSGNNSTPEAAKLVDNIRLSIIHHKPFTNVKTEDIARSVLGLSGSAQESKNVLHTVSSIVPVISQMCNSCTDTFCISDVVMILRGIRGLDFDNSDVQTLVASLAHKMRRLRNDDCLLLAEKELADVLSYNTKLKASPLFGNLASALGLKRKRMIDL